MDKETLSNYGWIVVLVLILAVMLALATPFGTFIAGAIKSTTAGLFSVNQSALGSAGINVDDMVFENCDHLETEVRNVSDTYTGDTCCKACGAVLQAGQTVRAKVPEGGKYTAADGTVYGPGDYMPETVTAGDIFEIDKYRYTYYTADSTHGTGWHVGLNLDVTDKKQKSYGSILENINGEAITSMYKTFEHCTAITTAPTIPSGVSNMYGTFNGCLSLETAPVIPDEVRNMTCTFNDCKSMLSTPKLPNSVIEMKETFHGCNALKTYVGSKDPDGDFSNYIIPDGVTEMAFIFYGCYEMTYAPSLPSNVTSISKAFWSCKNLRDIPDMSKATKLTSLQDVFVNCTSLVDLSNFIVPNTITNMTRTFQGCANLKTGPVIPDNVKYISGIFSGCTSLTTAIIPTIKTSYDLSMSEAFKNCTSLTGTVTINTNLASYRDCFSGVDFEKQNLNLAGSSAVLDKIGATGINYCAECNGCCKGGH